MGVIYRLAFVLHLALGISEQEKQNYEMESCKHLN